MTLALSAVLKSAGIVSHMISRKLKHFAMFVKYLFA